MAEEEVARFVVGNESGMCKAALVGDARRGCSVAPPVMRSLQFQSIQHGKTHQVETQ